ncbi:MAG: carboxypeptidase regulatory-like domain-containing protein [Candidatus Acidiferrales bacterium]
MIRLMMKGKALLTLLLSFLIVAGAYGQGATTAIVGEITDPQGAAVTGAKVAVSDPSSGVKRDGTTDATGHYQFLSLQPGTYTLRVEMQGFRTATTGNIEALVSTTQRVDIKLELGSMSETVTVTEGAVAAVNTTDATLGNAFDARQILAFPMEGRDAAGVLSLQPGVSVIPNLNTDTSSGTNAVTIDTRNGAVNGGRSDQANITLDGVDNNDQLLGTAFQGAVRSTLDSIEEFRVTTAGINADQGRSSGGQVTLVTKSGTNSFHGSAYGQNRSRNGEANDWFNKHNQLNNKQPNVPPELVRNVFGASLGGPILKDRLFFFGTYEGRRQNENQQQNRNVPGTNLRNGEVAYPNVSGGVTLLTSAQIKSMDTICTTQTNTHPQVTCPLGNGPDPAAIARFNQYPAPNSTTCPNNDGFNNISCFSFSAPTPRHENTSIAKIDYNLNRSGTHRVFLRGNYQVDSQAGPPQFPGLPPNHLFQNTSRALGVGYTAVFSSTLVNSFRYGYTRQSESTQGLQTAPQLTFRFIDDLKAATSTSAFHVPVHNFVDDLSWTRGKHTLQFGTNLRVINNVRESNATSFNGAVINPAFLPANPAGAGGSLDPGAFGFPAVDLNNPSPYNNAVIDLVGIVTQVTGNYNRDRTGATLAPGAAVPRHFRAWEYEWYVQDVWHVKPNLTVTAGLRYDILEPPYETNGTQAQPNISMFDFVNNRARLQALGQTAAPAFGFGLSGQANGKSPYWPYDFKNLGPRIAIAYSPNPSGGLLKALFGGSGKSSIRAGYGIVYDHFGQGVVNTFDQNGTFGLSTSITNPASVQTIDGGARFTSVNTIPTSSLNGTLLFPAPSGGFPAIPPISTLGTSVQQIAYGFDDKLKTPYSELVDFAITRELPGGLVFEAAYVGRFAHRLLQQRDLGMPLNLTDPKSGMNYFTAADMFFKDAAAGTPVAKVQPIPFFQNFFPGAAGVNGSTCGAGGPGQGGAPGNGALAPGSESATQSMYELFFCNSGPGTLGESNALFVLDAFCFPACVNQQPGKLPAPSGQPGGPYQIYNPQYTAFYAWSSMGKSGYNAGQFTLRSKPTHGVQFDVDYTFSKSMDVGSDAERVGTYGGLSAVVNTWSPFQLKGPSDFDARHLISSNLLFDLPFGRGRRFGSHWNRAVDTFVGGWEIVGLARWSSGLPFSVINGFDFPTNFQLPGNAELVGPRPATGRVAFGPNGDPYGFVLGSNAGTSNFNLPANGGTPSFRLAMPGESGQRNNFRGDGYFGSDAGVNKNFRITERQSLRFSAYAFNWTNSVRFDPAFINANLQNTAVFGLYSNTLTQSRRMEFALRYSF